MTVFSQRLVKACLHATYPVTSKDLSLGHFVGYKCLSKNGQRQEP